MPEFAGQNAQTLPIFNTGTVSWPGEGRGFVVPPRQERDGWKFSKSVGKLNAEDPTSAAANRDASARGAASGTVASTRFLLRATSVRPSAVWAPPGATARCAVRTHAETANGESRNGSARSAFRKASRLAPRGAFSYPGTAGRPSPLGPSRDQGVLGIRTLPSRSSGVGIPARAARVGATSTVATGLSDQPASTPAP